jgi:hypothetical protein
VEELKIRIDLGWDNSSIVTVFAVAEDNNGRDMTKELAAWCADNNVVADGELVIRQDAMPAFLVGVKLRFVDGNHRMLAVVEINASRTLSIVKYGLNKWLVAGNPNIIDRIRCRWLRMVLVDPVDVASYLNFAATNVRTNNMDSLYVTRVQTRLFLKTDIGKKSMASLQNSKHTPATGLPIKPLSDWLGDKPGVHKLRPTSKGREKFLRAACKMSNTTFEFMTKRANEDEDLSDKACQLAPLGSPKYPAVPYQRWAVTEEGKVGDVQLFGTQRYLVLCAAGCFIHMCLYVCSYYAFAAQHMKARSNKQRWLVKWSGEGSTIFWRQTRANHAQFKMVPTTHSVPLSIYMYLYIYRSIYLSSTRMPTLTLDIPHSSMRRWPN